MKKFIEKLKTLDKGTIIRTILQLAVYVNQFIALLGSTSFANSQVYQWITFGVTLVVSALSYWYNNDWTNGAMLTRDIFDMIKDGELSQQEVEYFISKHKDNDSKNK